MKMGLFVLILSRSSAVGSRPSLILFSFRPLPKVHGNSDFLANSCILSIMASRFVSSKAARLACEKRSQTGVKKMVMRVYQSGRDDVIFEIIIGSAFQFRRNRVIACVGDKTSFCDYESNLCRGRIHRVNAIGFYNYFQPRSDQILLRYLV